MELVFSVDKIKGWVRSALQRIFKQGNRRDLIDPDLLEAEGSSIVDAVETGLDIAYNSPNFEFGLKLRESGLWFAARKSYAQANELAALLDNGNGSKVSWAEFKKLANPVVGKYNQTWLRTEYDTATRSARIASQWKDMERTADLYPNVEYLRTRSATPREDHLDYVGIIRAITDAWWDTHTPPLGWNCKCGLRSTDKAVTSIPANLHPVPEGLQNNPARSGTLFSENHPYAKNARRIEAQLKRDYKQKVAKMGMHYTVKTPDGNIVLVHPGVEKNEMAANIAAAVKLADFDRKLQIKVRPKIEGAGSQPDFTINGRAGDLKTLKNPTNIQGAIQSQIKSAGKQNAFYAILDVTGFDLDHTQLRGSIDSATTTGRNKSVQEVYVINGKNITRIKRKGSNQK